MPMEDVVIPKAPKDWRPTSDQMQQIQNDSRLQKLSRDDLYFYFNQKGRGTTGTRQKGATAPAPPPASQGGIFGWVDSVRRALGGG